MFLQDPRGGATGSRPGPVEGQSTRSLVQMSDHTRGVRLRESGHRWRRFVEFEKKNDLSHILDTVAQV